MTDLLSAAFGGIEFRTVMAADLWPALVDPIQIESIILNLAINARDAMQAGGILTLERRCRQRACRSRRPFARALCWHGRHRYRCRYSGRCASLCLRTVFHHETTGKTFGPRTGASIWFRQAVGRRRPDRDACRPWYLGKGLPASRRIGCWRTRSGIGRYKVGSPDQGDGENFGR
jgi:hypothetical protein